MTQAAAVLAWRAQYHAWRGHLHEARWRLRAGLARRSSALLVICGALMAVGGGFLIGRWAAGLVIIAEAGGMIWFGMNRDDGAGEPVYGAHTVEDVLEAERWRP